MPTFDAYIYRLGSLNRVGTVRNLGGAIDIGNTLSEGGVLNAFWDTVKATEAVTGKTEFRCFYLKNLHPTKALLNPIFIVQKDTEAPGDSIAVGWGSSLINGIEQTIASESTPPTNVAFTSSGQTKNGAILGRDMPPLSHKAVWLRRIVTDNAQAKPYNTYTIRLIADNLADVVYNDPLNIPLPPDYSNILGIGETDVSEDTGDVVDAIRDRGGNLLITTGNHMQTDRDAHYWTKLLGEKLVAATRISFGPHDRHTRSCENHYMNTWHLSHRHYSYNLFNVHILHLDTSGYSHEWEHGSNHYDFVARDLQRANANPHIDWIMVVMNKAMYASTTTTDNHKILSASLRDSYHQIFQDNNVHLVVQGTFHNYQRMNCLGYNATDPDQPFVMRADEDPDYTIDTGQKGWGNGCIFLVNGSGGSHHENIASPASYMIYGNTSDHGYISFFFENRISKLITTFYNKHHEPKDTFSITHL